MKRKVLSMVLCSAFVLVGLAGCAAGTGAEADSKSPKVKEVGDDQAGKEEAAEEVTQVKMSNDGGLTEIVWQWPSTGSTGAGFQAVEDALNFMMEPDIGVHVTLEPVNFSNLANETVLSVSSGEQLDLCLSVGTGVGSLVSSGLIEPLDGIINEHGASIVEKCGSAMSGGYYGGELYGMPNAYIQGESYGYIVREDLLDKYNIKTDADISSIPWMNCQKYLRQLKMGRVIISSALYRSLCQKNHSQGMHLNTINSALPQLLVF